MSAQPSSWKELLANPGPDGHIVQLYQDADFYGEAISHFAAEGFERGESVIITATGPNWANISGRLMSKGFIPTELVGRGQLMLLPADETLPKFLAGNRRLWAAQNEGWGTTFSFTLPIHASGLQ